MNKWEYIEVVVKYNLSGEIDLISCNNASVLSDGVKSDWLNYLNKLGSEGWEMANGYEAEEWKEVYHFKRSVE